MASLLLGFSENLASGLCPRAHALLPSYICVALRIVSQADIEKAHEEAAKREEEEIARRAKANRSKRARRKAKKDKELADKASMAELAAKEGSDRCGDACVTRLL
eukprot:COSAG02_NODE_3821_length_6188_cov_3.353917_5_plen_105_part_00